LPNFYFLEEKSKKSPRAPLVFLNWLKKIILSYWGKQRRCLITIFVILVIFLALNWAKISEKSRLNLSSANGGGSSSQQIITEEVENSQNKGIMGGPVDYLSSATLYAEAAIDFTADDANEETDFALFEDSGLIPPAGPGAVSPFGSFSREIKTYIVQSGDTISGIAAKFNINANTIFWANNLKEDDIIKPGQTLTILPINGVRIKIGAKDTLESLAKKYHGKVAEIVAFNELAEEKLPIGDYIIIPNGEMPAAPKPITAPKYAQEKPSSGNWLIMPTSGKNWGILHNRYGVDISNVCGTPIYAAAGGTVTLVDEVGWNYGYGKYLMIKHPNGVVTLYAHTSRVLVEVGQQVSQGQLIALMGTTGRSTGCHLHFEVRGAKNPFVRR